MRWERVGEGSEGLRCGVTGLYWFDGMGEAYRSTGGWDEMLRELCWVGLDGEGDRFGWNAKVWLYNSVLRCGWLEAD